jgi:hypothetical protein
MLKIAVTWRPGGQVSELQRNKPGTAMTWLQYNPQNMRNTMGEEEFHPLLDSAEKYGILFIFSEPQ